MKCDQCEMLSINGVACHELGCPNSHARWDEDSATWVQQRECRECGCTVDHDALCCNPDSDPIGEYPDDDYDDKGLGE